jgi:hypothetical protein
MVAIGLGVILFVIGLVVVAAQPIWRARLSRGPRQAAADGTLEPPRPGAGFGLRATWPGLALIALGVILMLLGAMI